MTTPLRRHEQLCTMNRRAPRRLLGKRLARGLQGSLVPLSPKVDLIDWEPFLGRKPALGVSLPAEFFVGRRILITGAAGSIGSVLAKEIVKAHPSSLVLVDQSEFGLYSLDQELQHISPLRKHELVLGSVRDSRLLEQVFHDANPQIVFHAAAYKHVPLLERHPVAAVLTNVLATNKLLDRAEANQVEQCILVSTDKAVEPTSVMGATKRISECLFLSRRSGRAFKALRLGNVLGSSGSVVPLFLERIAARERIILTPLGATRYFMTSEEAAHRLMQSASPDLSAGLYIPPNLKPQSIHHLALFLMRESEKTIPIDSGGLRPGDKLSEQMIAFSETLEGGATEEGLQRVSGPLNSHEEVQSCLRLLEDAAVHGDISSLVAAIQLLVPEYAPSSLLRSQMAFASQNIGQ